MPGRGRALTLAVAALVLLSISGEAHATFPGERGKIAFSVELPAGEGIGGAGPISTLEPDGTGLTLVAGARRGMDPSWSPDGTRIAYVCESPVGRRRICVSFADGSGRERLTRGELDTDPAWSPDGTRIVYVSGGSLTTMDADGTDRERILPFSPDDGRVVEPAWSPDGARIAFQRVPPDGFEPFGNILTVRPDGSGLRALTKTDANDSPDWSPSGRRIAYVHFTRGNYGDIYTMRRDGTDKARLTSTPAHDNEPTWSPDGRSIIFGRSDPKAGLWIMTSGGDRRRLLREGSPSSLHTFSWQPLPAGSSSR